MDTVTPEVFAAVWHKWFGGPSAEPGVPGPAMVALATDLQAVQGDSV